MEEKKFSKVLDGFLKMDLKVTPHALTGATVFTLCEVGEPKTPINTKENEK